MKKEYKYLGFTLIELLAVIVVLALVAIIVTPMIMSTVTSSKENSFKSSAYNILDAANNYYMKQQISGDVSETIIDLAESDKIEYKGNKPKEGVLLINADGSVALQMNDGTTCATKKLTDQEITVSSDVTNCNGSGIFEITNSSCFTFDSSTGAITKYTCSETNVTIPKSIDGVTVKSIATGAFNNKSLTSVVLSLATDLTSIDTAAFANNPKLTYVMLSNLSKLKTIGDYSFSQYSGTITYNNATTQPNNLVYVDNDNNVEKMGYIPLVYNISSLDLTGLTSLETIGASAFMGSDIKTLKFDDLLSLKSIGTNAFRENAIKSIKINGLQNLESIGERAFYMDPNTNISLTNLPKFSSLGNLAFLTNDDIETFIIDNLPSLITLANPCDDSSADLIIENCDNLESLIYNQSFFTSLKSITLKNLQKLKTITTKFDELSDVTLINLPLITTISWNVASARNTKSVTIKNLSNLTEIYSNSYFNSKLVYLDLEDLPKLAKIGSDAFTFNYPATLIFKNLPSVTSISDDTFHTSSCSGQKTVTFENVSDTLKNAKIFYGC
jgi:prepilin-type N-terminal cleavage/methylation domain-containing protein